MIALALSSAYLLATVAIKAHVDSVTRASLRSQQIPAEQVLATPAFFNTLLWRVVVMTPDGYLEGYYSLLDSSGPIDFSAHPNHPSLLAPIHDNWAVARLRWFTRGFYRVQETATGITMADLRMGSEPSYIFSFRVGARSNGQIVAVSVQREPTPAVPPGTFRWAWRRTWGL
jgi:inner membrane protein